MASPQTFGESVGDISPADLSDARDIANMDDFASETDSDYTSYWRDWVSDSFCLSGVCVQKEWSLALDCIRPSKGTYGIEDTTNKIKPRLSADDLCYIATLSFLCHQLGRITLYAGSNTVASSICAATPTQQSNPHLQRLL